VTVGAQRTDKRSENETVAPASSWGQPADSIDSRKHASLDDSPRLPPTEILGAPVCPQLSWIRNVTVDVDVERTQQRLTFGRSRRNADVSAREGTPGLPDSSPMST
jgi:hypothetical protein